MTGKLLDVGCGDGSAAVARGWPDEYDYTGLDMDEDKLEAARTRGLTVQQHDVTEGLDYPDDEFDRVVCKAILEHVDTPLQLARECRRVLRPGGRLTVVVPSDRSYDVWGDYTHIRGFRKDALHDLLADAGFSDITIAARHPWDSPGAAVKSLGRMLAPWTPYGYPRAWTADARTHGPRGVELTGRFDRATELSIAREGST